MISDDKPGSSSWAGSAMFRAAAGAGLWARRGASFQISGCISLPSVGNWLRMSMRRRGNALGASRRRSFPATAVSCRWRTRWRCAIRASRTCWPFQGFTWRLSAGWCFTSCGGWWPGS
ncbi:MAG TPA: hypothetical protein DDX09_09580, partial [Hyphomonas atlantica]|nr:hypothetical protein [Hyphomonas atlantica]